MKKNNITVCNQSGSKIVLKDIFRTVEFFMKVQKRSAAFLSISFIEDHEMEELNLKYLSHKGSTDIITFDYSDKSDPLMIDAEIIICTDQAKRQAKEFSVTFPDELCRLVFHGLLHLTGFDDTDPKSSKQMKKKEDELFSLWKQYNIKS
jgi:probable rRNA maturation factor